MSYTLKTHLANKSNYGDARETSKIKYLVVHYTGNDGDTDENNGKYFANNIVKASAHYFVDDDSVTQSVPDDHVAWSVGGSKYSNCATTGGGKHHGKCTNANSINVELCDDVKNGTVYPSTKTIENAIELIKSLMKKYNIPASNVIRHFDVTGKSCPAYWVDDAKWKKEFWNKLSEEKTETFESYQIKVANVEKGDVLNIRNTASAKSKVTGTLEYNDPNKYTIVEEKTVGTQKWGKLKSDLGWINLYYTKKVTETTKPPAAPTPVKKEIKVGSTVKLKQGAKTYQGGKLASFVYERNHKVKQINVDRVVITYNNVVIAAVRKQDLILVE